MFLAQLEIQHVDVYEVKIEESVRQAAYMEDCGAGCCPSQEHWVHFLQNRQQNRLYKTASSLSTAADDDSIKYMRTCSLNLRLGCSGTGGLCVWGVGDGMSVDKNDRQYILTHS